eukprot:4827283-Amphidinium_carterae.2
MLVLGTGCKSRADNVLPLEGSLHGLYRSRSRSKNGHAQRDRGGNRSKSSSGGGYLLDTVNALSTRLARPARANRKSGSGWRECCRVRGDSDRVWLGPLGVCHLTTKARVGSSIRFSGRLSKDICVSMITLPLHSIAWRKRVGRMQFSSRSHTRAREFKALRSTRGALLASCGPARELCKQQMWRMGVH